MAKAFAPEPSPHRARPHPASKPPCPSPNPSRFHGGPYRSERERSAHARGGRPTMAAVSFSVRAITLDLDDTLWPFAPIGARIDQVLYEWMLEHSPATAAMYPVAAMRELRERSFRDNPHLHYDLSALRRLTLAEALENSGAGSDLLEPAYEAFYAARNQVEFYPDALDALHRIAARVPVAAVSNGNADLQRIGIGELFAFQLGSREFGAAKPDPGIFHAACERLGVEHAHVLHV